VEQIISLNIVLAASLILCQELPNCQLMMVVKAVGEVSECEFFCHSVVSAAASPLVRDILRGQEGDARDVLHQFSKLPAFTG
jgi:hypothetical protein